MRQAVSQIVISTRGRAFYEFTREVAARCANPASSPASPPYFVQHTSASLIIQENADPEVRRDFERFFAKLIPDGDPLFRHTSEGDDDMPAHIRAALTATQLSIPIAQGRLTLGTWQGIYLWEHRTIPHERRITAHFLGE
jgi:secondary thiamine-phosphate synthase enzyme